MDSGTKTKAYGLADELSLSCINTAKVKAVSLGKVRSFGDTECLNRPV